jgi:putative transposase
MPYTSLFYHLVWTTKKRHPFIIPEVEAVVYDAIASKTDECGGALRAIGGTENHIHLIVTVPPAVALAEYIRQVKGVSSHQGGEGFAWQAEYGVFTVSKRLLRAAIAYVAHQKKHHAAQSTISAFEP